MTSSTASAASSDAAPPALDCGTHEAGDQRLVSPEKIRELSHPDPMRAIASIALDYAAITFAIVLSERFYPWLYPVAFALIGARLLALAVLMHDAAHYRLFANRTLNDFVGSFVLGLPVLLSMRDYRKAHLQHHKHLATSTDPETPFRQMFAARKTTVIITVGSMIGISGLMLIAGNNRGPRKLALLVLPAVGALAWFAPGIARLLALYWLLPFFIYTAGVNVLRTFAEHVVVQVDESTPANERAYSARTLTLSWLARTFVAPHAVGYHLDHHLYPSVPFYNLPALHALLMQQPAYRERTREFTSYPDVLRDHAARMAPAA
jgi:fatty acid desaturase